MLQIRFCTDRKVNQKQLLSDLCACAKMEETGQILIVPEQFSHTTERLLCEYGGDRIGRYAEVLSFSRLANRVFSVEGGIADTQTDASGRLLMMTLAVEQVRSRLKIYGSSVSKPEFLLHLMNMFDEFRSYCITPQRLRQAAGQLSGVLAVKTEEFALLMESFDAVSANLGQNPESKLTRLLSALETGSFAESRAFWFDGFTDFNGVEQEIIAELLHKNASVTVLLQCDTLSQGAQQFDAARDTAKRLLRIAAAQGITPEIHKIPSQNEAAPLAFLRRHLFGGGIAEYDGTQDAVRFLHAPDREKECREAAREILRLVSEGNRWRCISVACAGFASYRPVLESVFRRFDIPAYFAGDTDILRHPVVRMLLSALQAATGGMEQEDVLNYLKSGLTPLTREACDRMENYVLLWNIDGSRFEKCWLMHPDGLRKEFDHRSQERLDTLNGDRSLAIAPLISLRNALNGAKDTGEMVRALYEFTEKVGLSDRIAALAEKCRAAGNPQAEQEYVQIYAIVTELMEQMFGVLGKSVRSSDSFASIFRAAISRCSVGTIPASLDCVTVGSLMSQRRCDTDYVFLIGAQEGSFPAIRPQNSLLTDSERIDLNRQGIEVAPTAAGNLDRELACIDSVLNAPNKRLYLSAIDGAEAYMIRRAAKLFPNSELTSDPTVCLAEREYLAYLVSASKLPDAGQPLREQAEKLIAAKDYSAGSLSKHAVNALYGETLRLSPSRIDKLAGCRFGYYLEYGLRAAERKPARIDASQYGTFVHDVLEHTVKQVQEEGGFHALSLERVLAIAQDRMEEYAAQELADLWESAREEYLFRRRFSEVRAVISDLYREMSRSDFEPKWFELDFSQGGTLPAIQIVGQNSVAELVGTVDRVDVWRSGDKLYVRVIDYKTGKTTFNMTKVLNGLGLQMLLYLFALQRMGAPLFGQKAEAAGVLYFPAKEETVTLPDKLDSKGMEAKRKACKKRTGMVLDSYDVLQAMERCEDDPVYLPYSYDKTNTRTGSLFTKDQLAQLERFVFACVGQLGDALYSGDITANPFVISDDDEACRYCPYQTVCREDKQERRLRKITKTDAFWETIGEVTQTDG
ncbi:MAG: PD-(D/E)XK nuclease family protein [Oscillospiraceae bacterium]|nr:PD-(D/E)XK nuclease family protein [Oscillospiraceae bacterium]